MGQKSSRNQANAETVTNTTNQTFSGDRNKQYVATSLKTPVNQRQFGMYSQPNAKTSMVPVVSALNLKQFAKDMLTAHNDYRKAHRAPRMSLDEPLCTYAQNWADVSILCVLCFY